MALPAERTASGERQVRLLIVDDSAVVRAVLERMLDDVENFSVVAALPDADRAIAFLDHTRVDLVLLDIEMPGRSGLDALPDLVAAAGNAPILVVSSSAQTNGPAAIRALELGAADTLLKPGKGNQPGRFSDMLIRRVRSLVGPARDVMPAEPAAAGVSRALQEAPHCLAIGASTGGIPALIALLEALDPTIDCPILVTQHLPAEFMPFLAAQLIPKVGRPVLIPADRTVARKGHIYLAPGSAHLRCRASAAGVLLTHSDEDSPLRYKPAVDPMFDSVAECYGPHGVGVVLTGMGSDGLIGAQRIVAAGGAIFAQDSRSSVVWGMPGKIAEAGIAHAIAEPSKIAALINAAS